jgi:hypothetical protein
VNTSIPTCMFCVERSVPKGLYTCSDVIEGASMFEMRLLDYKIRKMFFTCIVSRIVLLSSGLSRIF